MNSINLDVLCVLFSSSFAVSAFYVTCPQKQISLTGSVWTKSKFMGMSIGVTMIGGLTLALPEYNEVNARQQETCTKLNVTVIGIFRLIDG